jgi:hypothetical protein
VDHSFQLPGSVRLTRREDRIECAIPVQKRPQLVIETVLVALAWFAFSTNSAIPPMLAPFWVWAALWVTGRVAWQLAGVMRIKCDSNDLLIRYEILRLPFRERVFSRSDVRRLVILGLPGWSRGFTSFPPRAVLVVDQGDKSFRTVLWMPVEAAQNLGNLLREKMNVG